MRFKTKVQDFEKLKLTHPDLYLQIQEDFRDLPDTMKGKIAGHDMGWVIVSGGDVIAFQDELDIDEEDELEYDDFENNELIG